MGFFFSLSLFRSSLARALSLKKKKKKKRKLAMSIQFWMAASTITASQIMMGIGITSSLR